MISWNGLFLVRAAKIPPINRLNLNYAAYLTLMIRNSLLASYALAVDQVTQIY